jgi:catechol 2,3-dioxygenase-like lactoylglutathione lyase family enzyme
MKYLRYPENFSDAANDRFCSLNAKADYGFRLCAYLAVGDYDQCFDWLNRAIDQREPIIVTLKSWSLFDPLHADTRYPALLRRRIYSRALAGLIYFGEMATYKNAFPYSGDALSLPVNSVEEAISFYETVMGFRVVSRENSECKTVVLSRDAIRIGLAENGGDPTQNGCFFEVDDVENAFAELKARGLNRDEAGYRIDQHGDTRWRVFFVVAPDGLCYCLGQRQS